MATGGDSVQEFPIQHVVECEDCGEEGEVPWYCKNCPGSLCDKCKEAHQRSGILKKHSIVPRSSVVLRTYGPAKIAEGCKLHPEKEISTYCNDCKVPCCASCQVENHQRHSFSLIEDEYLAAETRLNDHIKDLEKNVLGKLADRKTKFQVKITKSEERTDELTEEISNFETEVVLAVRKTFDGFREKANISTDNFVRDIRDTDAAMEKVKREIEDCEKRIRIGKLDIIEYIAAPSDSHIPEMEHSDPSLPRFVPNRKIFQDLEKLLGRMEMGSPEQVVSQESDNPSKTKDTGIVSSNAQQFKKSMISVKMKNSFKCVFSGLSIVTVGHDKAWIIYLSSDTMHLYDVPGNLIKSKTIQRNCAINYMVIKRSGDMVISTEDNSIKLLSNDGSMSSLINTNPLSTAGLCLTDTEEIAVCLRGRKENPCVAMYSSDGEQMIRHMRGRSSSGNFCITDPFRMVNVGKTFVIVNYTINVVCVDENDLAKWQYKGDCTNLLDAFQPMDIDKDNFNNLLITDGKNFCVHYIDINGELLKIILTKEEIGLDYHWGISVNKKTGDVWLGNSGTSDIVVASYLSGCTK